MQERLRDTVLLRRFFESWLKERRSPGRESASILRPPPAGGVAQLSGFNKLVRGRHGIYLANENDAFIGRALIQYGEYGELEWQLLQRYCAPGAVVVEVGANIGSHTVALASAVGVGGKVIAVEPQPLIFQTLCANLALNSLTNVEAVNCGCGNRRQILHLPRIDYAEEGNFGAVELRRDASAGRTVPVEVRTLDDLLASCRAVSLMKIDVEGMEAEVIEGGGGTIRAFRPVIYVENDRMEKSRALIELIRGMGYRMWWHTPLLFNPENFFASSENLYPRVASCNMLCFYGDAAPAVYGLREVGDSSYHPAAEQSDVVP